jgi:hypothetical protein
MHFRVALSCILLTCFCASGQENTVGSSGDGIGKYIYRFPSFAGGTIVFRNGIINSAKLNYNIASDEMHFISQAGDTLSLADPATVYFISLQGSRFYYDRGFLQVIDTLAGITLAFKQELMISTKTKGAFGIPTENPSATSYNFFTVGGRKYDLDNAASVDSREHYLFGDAYGHFVKAGKEYILLHFKQHQDGINTFIKNHHTNFGKEEDLILLLAYCANLR